MQEEGKPRRGNQGWSTKGRAGRKPLPPGEKRKNRSLKATDEEWAKIQEFARKIKGGDVNMYMAEKCNDCAAPMVDCESCQYNIGIEDSAGRIDGPCGQQNCWYSCTVCEHNGGCYHKER